LRDRLRAMGFSESMVRDAVRAHLEAPRLAREQALRARAPRPWWQPTLPRTIFDAPNAATRELYQAERAELLRVLGPAGIVTREEIDRFSYLPEEKAAFVAARLRELQQQRRDSSAPDAPSTKAEAYAREQRLQAEYDRDLAAALTPDEREQVEMHSSIPAWQTSHSARYFEGTEAEFRAIYALQKTEHAAYEAEHAAPMESIGRSGIARSQKLQADLEAALGRDRYREWQRGFQEDHTMLLELQRRFAVPQLTLDAVAAVTRQISDEGMVIARDEKRGRDDRALALRDLADDARRRVIAILGDDLGEAYNVGSARGWLDPLERGAVPFIQSNGQRALFGVGTSFRTRAPPRK
jgi:hypothetical protein